MRLMWWCNHGENPDVKRARERLSDVEEDDRRVDLVLRKTDRMFRNNHLAESITKALRAK